MPWPTLTKSVLCATLMRDGKYLRPRPCPLFDIFLALSCLIFASLALFQIISIKPPPTKTRKNEKGGKTHSSAASLSNLLICSLASLTASLALASALSASFSIASAFITLSLAAIIVGSSSRRCKIPLRRWGEVELLVLVVETGETERLVCLEKREEWRRGGSAATSSGADSSRWEKRPIVDNLLG
jgi:hypothetical protein